MPDVELRLGSVRDDDDFNALRLEHATHLPAPLAEAVAKIVNAVGRTSLTKNEVVVRLDPIAAHYASWNVPTLEVKIEVNPFYDSRQILFAVKGWLERWFKDTDLHMWTNPSRHATHPRHRQQVFWVIDIIVKADRVCGVSFNIQTGETIVTWDDFDAVTGTP